MRNAEVPLPLLAAIAGTRGMLGAGIGLLVAGRLDASHRRRVGRALLIVGALSTIPLLRAVWKRSRLA